jgi:hypothetical protein
LPAALGNIKDDALVVWNRAVEKRTGVSEKKIKLIIMTGTGEQFLFSKT